MERFSVTALTLTFLATTGVATAQIPYQRYVPPSGPVLPYYLDYFRPQSGVLDQYNQFVAPKGRLQNELRTIVQQQNSDYGTLEQQIQKTSKIRPSLAAPTGSAAGFMNYSHYYQAHRGAAGTDT